MTKTPLSTQLGPLNLSNKIFIGAGAIKTIEDVRSASAIDDLSLILVGSYTLATTIGNPGKTYHYDGQTGTSINSIGLTNGGKPYLQKNLREMVKIAESSGKILGISVSGETPLENVILIKIAIDAGVQYFEVNTACGNIIDENTDRSKPIACYNPYAMENLFEVIATVPFDNTRHYKAFKVGKYPNFYDIDGLGLLHKNYSVFNGVVTSNTEKSTIVDDNNRPVIDPDGGFGGLGGRPLKPGVLGQVTKWRKVLPPDMDVIAVGGIFTGKDVVDYENCGAKAMQYVTSYLKFGTPDRSMQGTLSVEYSTICEKQLQAVA
jgi:dihydroorotate dehydrogenase (fumarate)